jgi:hypothetical protein
MPLMKSNPLSVEKALSMFRHGMGGGYSGTNKMKMVATKRKSKKSRTSKKKKKRSTKKTVTFKRGNGKAKRRKYKRRDIFS